MPKKPTPAAAATAKEPGEYTSLAGDWLMHFARLRQRAPELADRLAQQSDEFDLVPVPRKLLDALATPGASADQSLTLADLLARKGDLATEDDGPLTLAAALAAAMAAGASADVKALISQAYLDADGRSAKEIGTALDGFLNGKTDLSCTVLEMTELRRSPREGSVRLRLAWAATPAGGAVRQQEEVTLDLLVERDSAGLWKIASIATR